MDGMDDKKPKHLSRRDFIKEAATKGTAATLATMAGCSPPAPPRRVIIDDEKKPEPDPSIEVFQRQFKGPTPTEKYLAEHGMKSQEYRAYEHPEFRNGFAIEALKLPRGIRRKQVTGIVMEGWSTPKTYEDALLDGISHHKELAASYASCVADKLAGLKLPVLLIDSDLDQFERDKHLQHIMRLPDFSAVSHSKVTFSPDMKIDDEEPDAFWSSFPQMLVAGAGNNSHRGGNLSQSHFMHHTPRIVTVNQVLPHPKHQWQLANENHTPASVLAPTIPEAKYRYYDEADKVEKTLETFEAARRPELRKLYEKIREKDIDAQGYTDKIQGKSFAIPYTMGALLALEHAFGHYLPREHIIHALRSTCTPVRAMKDNPFMDIRYEKNATGHAESDGYMGAGAGLIDPQKAANLLAHMAAYAQTHPNSVTPIKKFDSGIITPAEHKNISGPKESPRYRYTLTLPRDRQGLISSTTLEVEAEGGARDKPIINVKSPSMTTAVFIASNDPSDYKVVTSSFFQGEKLAGEWTIESTRPLRKIRFNGHAYQPAKGGEKNIIEAVTPEKYADTPLPDFTGFKILKELRPDLVAWAAREVRNITPLARA